MQRNFIHGMKTLLVLVTLGLASTAWSQEITGSIRGNVTGPDGNVVSGETVIVTDNRTGSTRRVTTNSSGNFQVRGLTVGGPYTIRVDSNQYRDAVVTDVYTDLSSAASFAIALESSQGDVEEIVVVASAIEGADLAIGPSSAFTLEQIQSLPSIRRQIRDVIRIDPRVNIQRADGGNGFGINCLGGSGRSNSFTIDGVRSADGFGLNASGNSARNTFPIPFDTVGSASVEFAPIDVQYGQFTGCNVNVITKSGTNEFNGSVFYLFNDDSLTGDTLQGDTVITDPFEDKNYGLEIGGPIIKDKLFFYASYEETDEGGVQNDGPIGAGFANEDDITLADAERIRNILSNQYGRENLDIVRNLPQESKRYFGRIDWNINDSHRLEATVTHLEESNLEPDDFGFGGFTFADNFEQEGTEQDAYSLRVFSNWTDNFSTEFRYSSLEVMDIQGPLGGGEAQNENIPRIEVEDGAGNTILTSGPGFFRSANQLDYQLDQLKLAGDYVFGDHTLTFGYELDRLEVFNLFIPDATGTITFASIDDLETGIASNIQGLGSFTGNPVDAAAQFERDIHSLYLQDEWQISDALTLTAGLRYDFYSSSDAPIENSLFISRYGFSNATGFDDLDILMPRLGLTYDIPGNRFGDTTLSFGFGTFTGGDPTVWFANAFQNFGGAIGFGGSFACDAADLQVLNGGQFTGIPQCITDAQIAQANQLGGRSHAVDPELDLPAQNRYSFGLSHTTSADISFFNDWDIQFDYIYSRAQDALDFIDLTLHPGGPALPDGRPNFFAVDPTLAGCNATFIGPRIGFDNVTPACNAGGDDQDILLTNGPSGQTTSISAQFGKSFDFTEKTSLDLRVGYAYTDAEIANPGNSSTAESGFEEVATAVINRPPLAPAQYANKENFVLGATLKHYFFDDNPTSVGLFFRRRSGRPFSYVYDNNTSTTLFGDSDNEERILLYVPTGPNDPLVDFSTLDAQGSTGDFFAFLDSSGLSAYAGGFAGRNAFEQPWSSDLDLRIQQDIPLPWQEHSLKLFFDVENVLNLFSDSDNIQRFADNGDVGEGVPVLDAALSADGTQFVYSNFNPGGGNSTDDNFNPINDRDVDDSVWRIQFGLKYSF